MADALRTATFLAFRRLRDRPGDAVLTGTAVGLASLLVWSSAAERPRTYTGRVSLQRGLDGSDPVRPNPVTRLLGYEEERGAALRVATGVAISCASTEAAP